MSMFRVFWEIDIEAESPIEAARQALRIQRDVRSLATVFSVTPHCACSQIHEEDTENVDLLNKENPRVH